MGTQEYIDILRVYATEKDEQKYIDTFLNKTLIPIRQHLFKRINCQSGFLCCTGRCTTGCVDISIKLGEKVKISKVSHSSTIGGYIFELSGDGESFRLDQRGLRIRLEYGHATLE